MYSFSLSLVCSPIICLIISHLSIGSLAAYSQSTAVKGTLSCDGKPSAGLKVKLFDEDTTNLDEQMAEGQTDQSGHFELRGSEGELLADIVPKLAILHECGLPCTVQLIIPVPQKFVTNGGTPTKTFDIGAIRLEEKLKNFECFH